MAAHDSRWSDRRGRQDDRRRDYGKNSRHDYDQYDAYESNERDAYDGRDYPENYEQPGDLYENVPAARNIARIQITADDEEEDRHVPPPPQNQRYRDYDQHTIDRPSRGAAERREADRVTESQRRTEMERNAERSRQQAEVRRREEAEKQRRAEMEREAERKRQAAEQRRAETQRNQPNQRREPHLRYEPGGTAPYKQGIIDGFQQPGKPKNDYRDDDYRNQKKNEIPPAPPAPTSIKAIISHLKGNVSEQQKVFKQDDGRRDIPRNKVSTNPFIRGGDKAPSPARTPDTQPIKNVQEVVQKMNSGEWPIRVDEEEPTREMQRPRSQQSFDNHKSPHGGGQQKARHWEELERHSPDRRGERRGSRGEMAQRSTSSVRDVVRDAEEEQRRHESEFSERSDGAEVTTVSTDSAMGSDEASYPLERLSLPFELPQGTVLRKVPDNVKELNDEAEKLLIYFKGHRNILNYLGIGLSETLWNHIQALPEISAEIVVQAPTNGQQKKTSPQTSASQPTFSPKRREQSARSPERRSAPSRPAQSPKMTALERQLCTDMVSPVPTQEEQRQEARSGRFVKKSAAALIARKQGSQLQSDDEPVSSDFVDSRIAAEIEQLRAREDELKKNRSQLGLPTVDDIIEGWRGPQPYFDYHRQMPEHRPISCSHSAHNLFMEERSPSQNYLRDDSYEDQARHFRAQRNEFNQQRFERGEQFFRASESQLRSNAKCAVSRMDITVLPPTRISEPVRRRVVVGRSASRRRLRRRKSSRKGPKPPKYAVSFSEIVTSIF